MRDCVFLTTNVEVPDQVRDYGALVTGIEIPDQVRGCVQNALILIPQNSRMAFYTYIMACQSNTAIYIGVSGNLLQRVAQHRLGQGGFHTAKYRITKLVYAETHETLPEAVARERKLKRWPRAWKDTLIAEANPGWCDLAMDASFIFP